MDDIKMQFNQFLEGLVTTLEIPDHLKDEAIKRYEKVGEWLGQEGTSLHRYKPHIYPQGSFSLGTMIKPISNEDEYDIDLVCQLGISRNDVSPEELKTMVGKRLKENSTYNRMLEEKQRCWRLQYADSAKFHMDILPSIPELGLTKIAENIDVNFRKFSILIPDKELYDWHYSNPKGYAEWFKSRMVERILEQKKSMVEMCKYASVEEVPDYIIKTPLQRSIQILKRHRDIMFEHDNDNKPVSIIITTLAAHAHNNEPVLSDALINIVNNMPKYIEYGDAVKNPVNPDENFADKWASNPRRKDKFYQWLYQAQEDINSSVRMGNIEDISEALSPRFGEKIVKTALSGISISSAKVEYEPPKVEIVNPSKPWKGHEFK